MRLTVDVKGLDEATQSIVQRFSQQRVAAIGSAALTAAAVAGRAAVQREMETVFDKPTPYTLRSVRYTAATLNKLQSEVFISNDTGARDPSPVVVLRPQVEGGRRGFKGLELALRSAGALPEGWYVVPGAGARLDAYGNVSRGQITQVIAQIRRQAQHGPKDARRIVRTARSAGGSIFAVRPGGKRKPGVYIAYLARRNITPIFVFVNRANYRKRLVFDEVVFEAVERVLPAALARGFGESVGRVAGGFGARVIK